MPEKTTAPVATEALTSEKPAIPLDELITLAIEKEAASIHFGEGRRIGLRIGGKFTFIENVEKLSQKDADSLIAPMIQGDDMSLELLQKKREIDFSYTHKTGVNFRVNIFYQRGHLCAVMRAVPHHIPTMNELGTPEAIRKFLSVKEGLILVVGPAGSGKTTTAQAMLEHINENSVSHIMTVENPIEYIFDDKKSFFSQREVGKDVFDIPSALHSVDHKDANVIMVSNIDNCETLEAVLTAVELGHLVIANMTTKNARQTLERIQSMCPADQKDQLRERIANDLTAILAQDLAPKADGTGQVAVYEVLINTPQVKRVLRVGSVSQIENAIHAGGEREHMVTLSDYAYRLSELGIITEEAYRRVNGDVE